MDISEVIFSHGRLEPSEVIKDGELSSAVEQEHRKKIARDFESIFIKQLLETMQSTIPEVDYEDSSSKQVEGIYWSFLGEAVAEKGGFGLWEKIYEFMNKHDSTVASEAGEMKLDESI